MKERLADSPTYNLHTCGSRQFPITNPDAERHHLGTYFMTNQSSEITELNAELDWLREPAPAFKIEAEHMARLERAARELCSAVFIVMASDPSEQDRFSMGEAAHDLRAVLLSIDGERRALAHRGEVTE